MPDQSKVAVYSALVGNLAVAAAKYAGAIASGSAAMMAEAIHSSVDTSNELFLLLGMKRAQRPADEDHPFGHGKELFFWSLLVAMMIFSIGGGISVYEGILHIRHPEPLQDPTWNYRVLVAAFVFEGITLIVSVRAFLKQNKERSLEEAIALNKDPIPYIVIAEDTAALVGIGIAFFGVWASHYWNNPVFDGAASVLIGVLLAGVSILLIHFCRDLLVGAGVQPETARQIQRIVRECGNAETVTPPLSMYLGPEEVLLALDVRFPAGASANDAALAVDQIELRIKEKFPRIKRIYIEAQAIGSGRR